MHAPLLRRIALAGLFTLPLALTAQDETDALRLSGNTLSGTARALGSGGAFSAVGADFSSAWLNPAGFALYRKAEFNFSCSYQSIINTSSFLDTESKTPRTHLNFTQVGYVYTADVTEYDNEIQAEAPVTSGLKSWAFWAGYNQIENFSRRTDISAYNPTSSATDFFAGQAQGTDVNVLLEGAYPDYATMAAGAYIIDTSGGPTRYVPGFLGGQVQQNLDLEESGRVNEWNFGGAINIDDFISIGLGVGIQDVRYVHDLSYSEDDVNDVHSTWANDSTPLDSWSMRDYYRTRGTGINGRLGILVRPTDYLRIGLSATTPTWMSLTDLYTLRINSYFDNDAVKYGYADAESGTYSYNLSTPYKLTAGVAGIIGKRGFLSADLDITDYSTSRFQSRRSDLNSGSYYDFDRENQAIRDMFSYAWNLRTGGELRLNSWRLRAGYARYGSVLKDAYLTYAEYGTGTVQKIRDVRSFVTAGFGVKQKSYYLDLAFVQEMSGDKELFYTPQSPSVYAPELVHKTSKSKVYLTTGFTF